ncbi:MAG: selenocysteine-specific translation elongation factor, partial [bacterium]
MQYRLLATAGHVDHGKTELLKALTGQQTDRLDEEQERGLTIDLGFADMRKEDLHLGFVDVPGHHNFIKNMVSGIGSVQGVVFVVSAADGWEEQSQEHFEIIQLIEPNYCCFDLTKIDLVDEEMQLLARAEIEDAIEGTDYDGADIVPVSSTEPTGIESLRDKLFSDLVNQPDPEDYGKPYCPVDRVFTVKGQGTVITGSLSGGSVEVESQLVRLPDGETGRVRSIQQYHESTERAQPGSRVALNVPDWDHTTVERGSVATVSEAGTVTSTVDGQLKTPDSLSVSLQHDQQVLAYLGTDRETVQLLLEGETELGSDDDSLARLHWPEGEVFTRPGDRIILRDFSDRHLLGCLTVLYTGGEDSLHDDAYQSWLYSRSPVTPETLLDSELDRSGIVRIDRLAEGTRYSNQVFREVVESRTVLRTLEGGWVTSEEWLESEINWLEKTVRSYHENHPLRPGLPLNELSDRYRSTEIRDAIFDCLNSGSLISDGEH